MSSDVAPADGIPSLGVLMFVAYRSLEQRIFAAVQGAGFEGSLAQGRLFARIPEEGVRLTDLAEMAQVTKQTAGALIDQLETLGYVRRVPDPTDGRARLICIASRGRSGQVVARGAEHEVYAEWREHLGADDVARLTEILVRLREVTDPYR